MLIRSPVDWKSTYHPTLVGMLTGLLLEISWVALNELNVCLTIVAFERGLPRLVPMSASAYSDD